jgi:glycosyltransferase involved in cell wall biosynthesis
MDVLIIYQFCTFGGVERVVLNRAEAFKKANRDINLSVAYLHDSGALNSFQDYIRAHDLDERLSAFLITGYFIPELSRYDLILVIDTPQVLDKLSQLDNVYIECHTPYINNRQYLRNIPKNIKGIIVPSKSFGNLIGHEFPDLPPIYVLPNLVPDKFFEAFPHIEKEIFSKRPITYFARLDELKNFNEAARIFESYAKDNDVMFVVIGNGADSSERIAALEKKGLLAKSLLRGGIDFDKAPYLINLVKRHRGLFISPSKAESFGLSAAEFISGGVPVLLSNIPEHRALVENDERFLYSLGDLFEAKEKLDFLLQNWIEMSNQVVKYAKKFDAQTFIAAWDSFIVNAQK